MLFLFLRQRAWGLEQEPQERALKLILYLLLAIVWLLDNVVVCLPLRFLEGPWRSIGILKHLSYLFKLVDRCSRRIFNHLKAACGIKDGCLKWIFWIVGVFVLIVLIMAWVKNDFPQELLPFTKLNFGVWAGKLRPYSNSLEVKLAHASLSKSKDVNDIDFTLEFSLDASVENIVDRLLKPLMSVGFIL